MSVEYKTEAQLVFSKAIYDFGSEIVIGHGCAGTGKTFIAIASALSYLNSASNYKKVIVTKPIVEAGKESIGLLPGELEDKIRMYFYPLIETFKEAGCHNIQTLIAKREVEFIPLSYMRGKTFNNCYVLLDEAQNTTKTQIKMFLTRIGCNTKMIITGDTNQCDLYGRDANGLRWILDRLQGIDGISMVEFFEEDIVRNGIIRDILFALERREEV